MVYKLTPPCSISFSFMKSQLWERFGNSENPFQLKFNAWWCQTNMSSIFLKYPFCSIPIAKDIYILGLLPSRNAHAQIQFSAEWCGEARFVARIEPARLSPLPLARATFFTQSRFYQSAEYCTNDHKLDMVMIWVPIFLACLSLSLLIVGSPVSVPRSAPPSTPPLIPSSAE